MNPEAIVIGHLVDEGYPAYADVPADRPDEFVTVELTGASRRSHAVWSATLAVQCFARTRYEASELACGLVPAIESLVEEPEVTRAEVDNLYNYTDLESGQPCYQLTVSMTARP